MRGPRLITMVALLLALAALSATGCGDDDEGPAEPQVTAPEPAEELPPPLVAELEEMCGKLITDIGSLEDGGDLAARIDELQDDYIADLEALADRVPEESREAFDDYVEAQEKAFELSPPVQPGEPQPELEQASVDAEAAAAELGFASCSSV